MHHEFFRLLSKMDDECFENNEWKTINPEEFEYGALVKNQTYGKNGFLNYYSTIGVEEDKSEIFSFMFNNPTEAFETNDQIIRKKIMLVVSFFEKFDPRGVGGDNFWIILRELRKNLEKQFIFK